MATSDGGHPAFIPPMKAVAGVLPTGPGWHFELKWDGMRVQASSRANAQTKDRLELRSGSGRIVTSHFPELRDFGGSVALDLVVDGELVVMSTEGEVPRPSFSRLQQRIHVSDPSKAQLANNPVVLVAFDLLSLDGKDTTGLAYLDRRNLLHSVLEESPDWLTPAAVAQDGESLLKFAEENDLEGLVAKRSDSTYEPGSRSSNWVKIKIRRRQEFVVGGWLRGEGERRGTVGSLLVGVWEGEQLHFAGAVASGLTEADRSWFGSLTTVTQDSPFSTSLTLEREPVWLEPDHVVEVGFAEWETGRRLRHPTYQGRRTDKDPRQVFRDTRVTKPYVTPK